MNKKTIITILLALVTMTGQAQTKNYTIRGNLSEVAKATAKQGVSFDSVTIMNIATNEVISKQTIQDGVFTINGTIEKPFYALLCIWSSAEVNGDRKSKKSRIPIIIEPGDIMFDGNQQIPVISGTVRNNVLSETLSDSRWDRYLGMTAAMTQVPHGYPTSNLYPRFLRDTIEMLVSGSSILRI